MYSFLKLLNELSSDFNTPIVESMISIQYDKISLNIPYGGVKRISKGLIFFITRPPIIGGGPIVTVFLFQVAFLLCQANQGVVGILVPYLMLLLLSFYSSILSILHIECMSSLTIKILLFV